jgi:hypothetical protein
MNTATGFGNSAKPRAKSMCGSVRFVCAIAAAALLLAVCAFADSVGTRSRSVSGTVRDKDGEPVRGAAVQIEDMLTLNIRSYITHKRGRYHFDGLYTNVDYRLWVERHDVFGPEKTLSRFDTRKKVMIDLTTGHQ